MAFTSDAPAPGLAVTIDGRDTVITAATDRLEAFRELARGEHRIAVEGNNAGARLVVRSIPEIFNYPPCANSHVKENGSYDWKFMKRHILHAVTTLNGGNLPGDALPQSRPSAKWLCAGSIPRAIRPSCGAHGKTAGMTQPQYDGFTCDELFFARATIASSQALKELRPENRLVYTWIVGMLASALHAGFVLHASTSRGRGRCCSKPIAIPRKTNKRPPATSTA